MQITISTHYDITNTDVTRKFNKNYLPLKNSKVTVTSEEQWVKARRQQSNFETLIQIVSLRSQPYNISVTKTNTIWELRFTVDSTEVFKLANDHLAILRDDCSNVPMLTDLNETSTLPGYIIGDENTWFTLNEL